MTALARAPLGDAPLSRRNPTVKLAALTAVSLAVVFVLDPLTPLALYALALTAVAVGTRAAPRTLVLAQLPFLVFGLGVLSVNVLTRPGEVLWQWGVLRVTVEGLEVGAALGVRSLVIGVCVVGFLLSTDGVALMTSLHHNARLGARMTYAVLAGYRMLQEMPREWSTIRHAHAARSPDVRGRPPRGARHLAGVVFTLLVVSLRKGERMAQALESRGLGLAPRTTWRPTPVRGADWALLAGVLAVLAAVLVVSHLAGTLRGPGALFG
ncbi:energy-coupling factor transporter transmembrane component T family protein [Georgenia sp. Z1344]|uniref:energy-coupling factor transporter transmembrane component T family protein n=1 Tax=Georgenia sp. Z1344 TaxID=3416706 RepID=UPI003CEB9D90